MSSLKSGNGVWGRKKKRLWEGLQEVWNMEGLGKVNKIFPWAHASWEEVLQSRWAMQWDFSYCLLYVKQPKGHQLLCFSYQLQFPLPPILPPAPSHPPTHPTSHTHLLGHKASLRESTQAGIASWERPSPSSLRQDWARYPTSSNNRLHQKACFEHQQQERLFNQSPVYPFINFLEMNLLLLEWLRQGSDSSCRVDIFTLFPTDN